jgi:hypothetical protein
MATLRRAGRQEARNAALLEHVARSAQRARRRRRPLGHREHRGELAGLLLGAHDHGHGSDFGDDDAAVVKSAGLHGLIL